MSYVEQNKNIELEILKTPLGHVNSQPAVITPDTVTTLPAGQTRRLPLFGRYALDLALIYCSFLVAYFVRYNVLAFNEKAEFSPVSFQEYLGIGAIYTIILFAALNFKNYYKLPRTTEVGGEWLLIGNAVLVSTAILTLTMLVVLPDLFFSRLVFIYLAPITIVMLGVERLVVSRIRYERWRRGINTRNLIVVGASDAGVRIMRTAAEKAGLGYKLLGFVDDQVRYSDWILPVRYGNSTKRSNQEVPHLGRLNELSQLIRENKVDEVMIALPSQDYQTVNSVIAQCREHGVAFTLVPDISALKFSEMSLREINGVPLIVTNSQPISETSLAVKRAIDFLGALVLILAAAIPMLLVALAVKLDSKGPVIFRQTRVGKDGKTFTFYKFRSMYIDADARLAELEKLNETSGATFKMKNDPRVTKVGRFIRRTSLDELPQFFNVLFGQMSLVGPRPGLPREVARYDEWHYRRLEVTPGLTGLWQVSGRSSTTFEEMVKLDIYYAEHWSLALDIKILFKTIKTVVKGDGAY